ncbi:ZYBA0S03-12420g1_1 [Zygosaccharomyces bailii CLIB 213]|uniref:Exocyst complex component SEC5 n=1 Tax=Zygosaccharomyces bailii (strain CLIB 213 / ATCC 58445 / CBS 680 / BCRC 21525 / NBRC 1098 / NCYC 1416 / NRRL Y-2227) TaxID=1333698 RepID=A0A8J2T8J1_ZYGB2|nr:ZYBA0S03-12420g1_1 [Zygosaccharomyces bailii CLIB 213]
MDPFGASEEQLLEFYHLKTLEPHTSWKQDSSLDFNLERWQNVSPDADNSYDILKDLLYQQQQTYEREVAMNMNDAAMSNVADPLNNKMMLPLLNKLHIPQKEKLKYLVNTKKFNVKMFLKDIHNKDSFDDLSRSLDILDKTLESQSEELKDLVQNNFTKYVRIKNRLDQIYEQFSMRYTPTTEALDNNRGQLDVNELGEKVDDAIRATTLKLKPLLETNRKINNYQATRNFIEENKEYFNLTKKLKRCLDKKDYSSLIIEYSKAKELHNQLILDAAVTEKNESGQIVNRVPKVVDKVWDEVERIVDNYRQYTWKMLLSPDEEESQNSFLPLISKLLDLTVDKNPIMAWLTVHLDHFEKRLQDVSSQMLNKIVKAQNNILQNKVETDSDEQQTASIKGVDLSYYLSIGRFFHDNTELKSNDELAFRTLSAFQGLTDSPVVVEMWLLFLRYINSLEKLCMKFVEFWEHVQNFLDGVYQITLINDKKKDNILVGDLKTIDGHKQFLQLEKEQIKHLRNRGEHFVNMLSNQLTLFFMSSQDSLSGGAMISKETGLPSDYGFTPPMTNGLSCLRYLPKMVEPLLKSVTKLAQLGISSKALEISRKLVSMITDRSVGAIAATKLRDTANFYKLEDWKVYETVTEANKNKLEYGVTQFPEIVRVFQEYSIQTTRDLLFAFEKLPVFNGISIVTYPSKRSLTAVEIQQLISMEAVLEAILKNAAKDKDNPRNSHTILTLTNLQYIRETTFPQILQYFDEAFEWNLREKKLELFSLLSKMESSIFGNYLSDLKINIRDVLEKKFHEISWATYTSNSFRAHDYVIEVLMLLVTIHSECFRIGPQLIEKVLKETQIFIAKFLFESFKPYIGNLSSDGLLQVTVDLQFFQRVLGKLLERDTEVTITACLQNCFQNNVERMQRCIKETEPIVSSNLARTSIQFAAFK